VDCKGKDTVITITNGLTKDIKFWAIVAGIDGSLNRAF